MKIRNLFEKLTYNWPVKILCICAAVVLSFFYGLSKNEERYITVPLHLLVNDNLTTRNVQIQTARVTLIGREEDIFHIREDSIYVYVDFTEYSKEGEYKASIDYSFRDLAYEGMDIEVNIDPAYMTVELETKFTRNVEIDPVVTGYPKMGFDLTDLTTTPEVLEITGPRSTIEPIDKIKTANIDISGLDSNFNYRVPLMVPPGNITVTSGRFIEVSGKIGPTIIAKTFDNIDITFVGLNENLFIDQNSTKGSIRLRGTQLIMDQITQGDFTLMVNCSAITAPGRYTLPIDTVLPLYVEKVSIDPEKITFSVGRLSGDGQQDRR